MILGPKIGDKFPVNDEMTCTKGELAEAKKNGTIKDLMNNTCERVVMVACDIDEQTNLVVLEDSTGRLHLSSVGALSRSVNVNMLHFLELKDIDFDTKITEPFDDFEWHERAQPLIDKLSRFVVYVFQFRSV